MKEKTRKNKLNDYVTNNLDFQKNKCAENIILDHVEKIYQSFQNGHFIELTITDLGWAYDSV